jgi:hypothetical protein
MGNPQLEGGWQQQCQLRHRPGAAVDMGQLAGGCACNTTFLSGRHVADGSGDRFRQGVAVTGLWMLLAAPRLHVRWWMWQVLRWSITFVAGQSTCDVATDT